MKQMSRVLNPKVGMATRQIHLKIFPDWDANLKSHPYLVVGSAGGSCHTSGHDMHC